MSWPDAPLMMLAVCGVALVAAVSVLVATRRASAILACALAASLIMSVAIREFIAPRAERVLVSRSAERVLAIKPGEPAPLVVGYGEPSLVFRLGTQTALTTGEAAGAIARADQPALVEARERDAFEAALHAHGLWFEPTGAEAAGLNYSNGDEVRLQPGRVRKFNDARN
jgi:hypothetical protein